MKTGFFALVLTFAHYSWSQLTEQFSDGDFTANPAWTGSTSTFTINTAHELQTANSIAATSYLTTPHGLSSLNGQEWRMRVKITTAPSSGNYARVFLTASGADISLPTDGFFLQFGESGSADAVRLKKVVGGVETEICAGPPSQIAAAFNMSVRVVRDAAGLWSLYTDNTGGINYTLQNTGTDAANLLGTYFGVEAAYTASNANKYYFDDIYAGPEIIDAQAPALVSATPVSDNQVDILFDEIVSGAAALSSANYVTNPAVTVATATIDGSNGALVHLALSTGLSNGQQYTLHVSSIEDVIGNTAINLSTAFTYLVNEIPEKGDVILTEFMCDPSPGVGLPEVEFVEIHNVSDKYFDLSGWKIGDNATDGTITAGWIAPGEYKLLCATSSLEFYPSGLAVTSFPSLNNASDDIVLKDAGSVVIDNIHYTSDWYRDILKQEGGYTIELINPNDPCSDYSNWTGSNAVIGGTPAEQNSVYDATPDAFSPMITGSLAIAPDVLKLTFSEGMDSTMLVNALFQSDPALSVLSIAGTSTFPDTAIIHFTQTIVPSQLYTYTYGTIADCWLNATTLTGSFALADISEPGDLVINEILFDPGTGGYDFVELYNRSDKVLDLKGHALANSVNDTIANSKLIPHNRLLFPQEYIVLTADSNFQLAQFPDAVEGTFYQLSLPAFGNDSSTVILHYNETVLDRVSYKADWHLALIDNTENKTLERIDPAGKSNTSSNWHTAAEPIGFGTPGKQNSQYQTGGVNGDFGTLSPLFSPDNDGFEDALQFYYKMPQPGMISTVTIYDDQGRSIRELMKSELLGLQGNFSWDGINDTNGKAPIGIYLAVIEAFTLDGKANFSKRIAFTLAGKLD